jgi:hypothetical protein
MRKTKAAVTVGFPVYVSTKFTPEAVDWAMNFVGINHQHVSKWADYISNPTYLAADALIIAGAVYVLSTVWDNVANEIK